MASWVPIMMLVLAGFFVGGLISFVRSKSTVGSIISGIAAILCGFAAYSWWQ